MSRRTAAGVSSPGRSSVTFMSRTWLARTVALEVSPHFRQSRACWSSSRAWAVCMSLIGAGVSGLGQLGAGGAGVLATGGTGGVGVLATCGAVGAGVFASGGAGFGAAGLAGVGAVAGFGSLCCATIGPGAGGSLVLRLLARAVSTSAS